MDVATWAAAVTTGTLLGATGLLPGLHINTVVAFAAAAALSGSFVAVALVCAACAHAFFAVLPGTYVGVPGDDTALSVLPAQRMVRGGQGPDAVHAALDAVLLASLTAIPLLLPAKWLLAEPGRVGAWLAAALPWLLPALLAWLAVSERRKGWSKVAGALLVQAAAGTLGVVAAMMHVAGVVVVPSATLLPLLAGLFGAAGLVASLTSGGQTVVQAEAQASPVARCRIAMAALRGVGAGLCTASVPGMTPAVGASLAYGRRSDDPRHGIAALAATGATHQLLAVGLVFVTLHARTGLAAGIVAAAPTTQWIAGPPPADLVLMLAAALTACLMAWSAARFLERPWRVLMQAVPRGAPEVAALAVLVALVATTTGVTGLALLGTAATVGLLPIAAGLRRVHLVAVLIIPLLAARLGLTP